MSRLHAMKTKKEILTPEQAIKLFGFPSVMEFDIFALEIDSMINYMETVAGAIEPCMVDYIDLHFTTPRNKIFAGMYAGAKLNEKEWIRRALNR